MGKNPFLYSFIIALAVFAVYGRTLHYPFVFDDFHAIVNNPYITSLSYLPKYFYRTAEDANVLDYFIYRPLLSASLAFNYALGGLDTTGYHVFNIAVHTLNSILVYHIAAALLEKKVDDPVRAALFAGLLFAIHPLQTESVTYIVSRSVAMAAFFYLCAFYLYLRSREHGWRHTAALTLLLLLGLLSKEAAVSLPAMLLLYALSFGLGKKPYRTVIATLLAACGFTAYRFYVASLNQAPPFPRSLSAHWMTEAYVIPMYVLKVLFPFSLNMDHYLPPVMSVSDPRFFASVLVLLAAAYGLYRLYRFDRLAGFLATWFFIAIAPETVVPIIDFMAERRTYLPMAGLSISGGYFVGRFGAGRTARARAVLVLCIATLVLFGTAAAARNSAWSSEESIWEDTVSKSPGSVRAYIGLGLARLAVGDNAGAGTAMAKALELEPGNAAAGYNMGRILAEEGRPDDALRFIREAYEKSPGDYEYAAGLARLLAVMKKYGEAAEVFGRAVRLQPDAAWPHRGLGGVYLDTGRQAEAAAEFERAVELSPHDVESRKALGGAYYRAGLYGKAAGECEEAVRLAPDDAEAHYDYALALAALGERQRAAGQYGLYREITAKTKGRTELQPPPPGI